MVKVEQRCIRCRHHRSSTVDDGDPKFSIHSFMSDCQRVALTGKCGSCGSDGTTKIRLTAKGRSRDALGFAQRTFEPDRARGRGHGGQPTVSDVL